MGVRVSSKTDEPDKPKILNRPFFAFLLSNRGYLEIPLIGFLAA